MMRNSFSPCLLILEEFARLLVAKRAQFMSSCGQQRDSSKWNFAKGFSGTSHQLRVRGKTRQRILSLDDKSARNAYRSAIGYEAHDCESSTL
jgi:hypothetical protein